MSALGAIATHDLHADCHALDADYKIRSGPSHDFHGHARQIAPDTPDYLGDYAHYPVRINGRPHLMTSLGSQRNAWPFTLVPQPYSDAYGRIIYHPGIITLLWSVSAGAHNVSVDVKHHCESGALPQLQIRGNQNMDVADAIATAVAAMDAGETLSLTINPTLAGTIMIDLINTNPLESATVTWGDIATT